MPEGTRLKISHVPKLMMIIGKHAASWTSIATALNFSPTAVNKIQAKPLLLNDAPGSWLRELLKQWVNKGGATLEVLVNALRSSIVGLGAAAEKLWARRDEFLQDGQDSSNEETDLPQQPDLPNAERKHNNKTQSESVCPPDNEEPKYKNEDCSGTSSLTQLSSLPPTTKKSITSFAKNVVIILHVCNDFEYWAAVDELKPPILNKKVLTEQPVVYSKGAYIVGMLTKYKTAIVKTPMGNECRLGLRQALKNEFPRAKMVIGAGIAYSNNPQKHKYADILVSKQIENFAQTREVNGETINPGERIAVGKTVTEVFVHQPACGEWDNKKLFRCTNDDKRSSKVHCNNVVSQPALMRDGTRRKRVMQNTRTAVGGEMEGWVLYELLKEMKQEEHREIEIIVIKGVVNFGDNHKSDKWQYTAAKAALHYIRYCLEKAGHIDFLEPKTSHFKKLVSFLIRHWLAIFAILFVVLGIYIVSMNYVRSF